VTLIVTTDILRSVAAHGVARGLVPRPFLLQQAGDKPPRYKVGQTEVAFEEVEDSWR